MTPEEAITDLRRQLAEAQASAATAEASNATLLRMLERQGYQLDRMQDQLERALRELEVLRRLLNKPPPDEPPAGQAPAGPDASGSGATPPPPPPPARAPRPPRKKKGHFGRNAIPASLPRIEDRHVVEVCEKCGGVHQKALRTETVEYYDYEPARVVVREVIREVDRCLGCQHIAIAPFPEDLAPRLRGTPALIAQIIYEKHGRALSLHRVDQELERLGAQILPVTRDSWLTWAARQLARLSEPLKRILFEVGLMNADGTGFDVIEPKLGTRLGQMSVWANDMATFYTFTRTKEGLHQRRFLGLEGPDGKEPEAGTLRFYGLLIGDAASTADQNFKDGLITECGCNAHARRKFEVAEETDRRRANEAVAFWTALYAVEKEATRKKLDAAGRLALRQEKSAPVVADLRIWLDAHRGRGLPKEPLTKALNYLHNHWTALMRFLTDGRIPIDNNRAERLLKIIAVGRHNFLFAGSDAGAERSALFFTFVMTCKQHGVDPVAWLTDVLPRIATTRPAQYGDLLPHRWRDMRKAASATVAAA